VFDEKELRSAVDAQRRSYRLLRWVATAVERGFIQFNRAHAYARDADAAAAWIDQHFADLPVDGRPEERSGAPLRRFANVFTTYLLTSFEIVKSPGVRLASACGCFCPFCAHLSAAPRLKAKNVSTKDKLRAARLKRDYVEGIALESRVAMNVRIESALLDSTHLGREVALATYGRELLRRCEGVSSGPAVLALWRQFAWKPSGSPIPNFELEAGQILEAERRVIKAVLESGWG
jgi:hypothetical protein